MLQLFQAVMVSQLRSIVIDVRIRRFLEFSRDKVIIVDFEMALSRSYAPEASMVQRDLQEGLFNILNNDSHSGVQVLAGTDVMVDREEIKKLEVIGKYLFINERIIIITTTKHR